MTVQKLSTLSLYSLIKASNSEQICFLIYLELTLLVIVFLRISFLTMQSILNQMPPIITVFISTKKKRIIEAC